MVKPDLPARPENLIKEPTSIVLCVYSDLSFKNNYNKKPQANPFISDAQPRQEFAVRRLVHSLS